MTTLVSGQLVVEAFEEPTLSPAVEWEAKTGPRYFNRLTFFMTTLITVKPFVVNLSISSSFEVFEKLISEARQDNNRYPI